MKPVWKCLGCSAGENSGGPYSRLPVYEGNYRKIDIEGHLTRACSNGEWL